MYSSYGRGAAHDPRGPSDSNNSGPTPATAEDVWKEDNTIMIGIDIGSTQSGVAFTFLQKGARQIIYRVGRWPGQASESQSKIPTLIWYDKRGKAVLFGAEAASPEARDDADDLGWSLAKHFKLHLHPSDMRTRNSIRLDPLPNGVPLHQIYADFMRYLLQHTEPIFVDQIVDGRKIWDLYRSQAVFIIAHPNGWGIRQQGFLRRAAIEAGLVDTESASARIRFVTEAEASVHYCIRNSNIASRIQPGLNFAVCDAGGSTIDTTVYTVTSMDPILKLAEKRDSACVQAGGIYVDEEAKKYLEEGLRKAKLSDKDIKEYLHEGVKDFETRSKRLFSNESEKTRVRFGNPSLDVRDQEIDIRRGAMTLSGATVKSFFSHCVNEITTSVDEQIRGMDVSHMLLVGGFGDSPYLQRELKERYDPRGCQLTTANDSTSKAVAEGAVIWNTITSVYRRAPRWSFGIQGYTRVDADSNDHGERTTFIAADGYEKVSGIWCEIVKKGVPVDADDACRQPFVRTYATPHPNLTSFEIALYSYSGDNQPKWLRNEKGTLLQDFENVCLITADLRSMSGALEARIGPHGKRYWGLLFWVCVRFGDTETSAYIEWEEKGKTRYGPISIVPEELEWN